MILLVCITLFFATFVSAMVPIIWDKKALKIGPLLSFCSGVLIGTAFLYMLPAAMRLHGPDSGFFILIGFLILYILERFIMIHPCQEHGCLSHHIGISAFFGLTLHCLLTGFSMGIVIKSSEAIAILTPFLTAIIAHKIPESFSLSTLLIKSNLGIRNVVIFLLLYCLATPLGIALSDYSLNFSLSSSLSYLLSISTGMFIYIATSDLLPQVHHRGKERFIHLAVFILGLLCMYLVK